MPRIILKNGYIIDTDKEELGHRRKKLTVDLSDFSRELKLVRCLTCKNTPHKLEPISSRRLAALLAKYYGSEYDFSDTYIRQWRNRLSKIKVDGKMVFDEQILSTHGRNGYLCDGYIDNDIEFENIEKHITKRFPCPKLDFQKLNNIEFDGKITPVAFRTSIILLACLRKAPGTISEYDLLDLSGQKSYVNRFHDDQESFVNKINGFFGFDLLMRSENNTENPHFSKVVTAPDYRAIIDLILDYFLDSSEKRFYNPAAFSTGKIYIPSKSNDVVFTIEDKYIPTHDRRKKCIRFNGVSISETSIDSGMLKLYDILSEQFSKDAQTGDVTYTRRYSRPDLKKDSDSFTNCLFRLKDIEMLFAQNTTIQDDSHATTFIRFALTDCILEGDLFFKDCTFINSIRMDHSVFLGDVLFENCSFSSDMEHELTYTFRDSVFLKSLYFKYNRLNTKGIFATCCTFSFEDAIFKNQLMRTESGSNEIASELVFRGNRLDANAHLDFYQTDFGEYRIEISDCDLSRTVINMNSSRLLNRLVINEAGDIWNCDFRFSVGNRFVLANSNLTGIMKLANIAQFELLNTTLFFGLIVSPNPENWDFKANHDSVRIRSEERYIDSRLYPLDAHPLLRACVNRKDISKQILIIKECFHRTGDIAFEEQANQLYLQLQSPVPTRIVQPESSSITIRQATEDDGPTLMQLAYDCDPLDKHTEYTYWLLTHFASDSCFIAYSEAKKPIGFISGFEHDGTGFIWQLGLLPAYRKQGIAQFLILNLTNRFFSLGCTSFEVTISSENKSSLSTFRQFCKDNHFQMAQRRRKAIHDETLYEITKSCT